ncbi:MAG: right-handed parallel beta-helix repeat-containing protein [Candidatus Thorarchaeota archaeon]|nr:right-handed parallel beta-helix repeat-containing protein [Candidatus Thorarchaeota archaeon]
MRNKYVLTLGLVLLLTSAVIGYSGDVSDSPDLPDVKLNLAVRTDHGPIFIANNSDFLIQKDANNWNGTGEENSPITIADYRIEFSDEGITIRNVDLHFAIVNCETADIDTQYWGSTGIKLDNCSNGLINNSLAHMKETGILIYRSSHIKLAETTVYDCAAGVSVSESHHITVCYNNFSCNDFVGINMTLTEQCTVYTNSIMSVLHYGIMCIVDTSSYIYDNVVTSTNLEDEGFEHIGIFSFYSLNLAIQKNDVAECAIGLEMESTDGASVWDCSFANTTEYGIYLHDDTHNVTIVQNCILPSEGITAYDAGDANSWDDGIDTGNTWSDYDGTGYYYISGPAGSIDHYPSNVNTTDGTPFELPSEITFMISIGSAAIIVVIVIVMIRGKQ